MALLDGMSSFVAVIEQGSFTKAADHLGQTKSSISKHITKLEERLNVKLLNRTTRALTLTDAGQNYFEKAKAIIEQAEEAEAEITSLQISFLNSKKKTQNSQLRSIYQTIKWT